jgi:glucose/arabinose dehydrogenase
MNDSSNLQPSVELASTSVQLSTRRIASGLNNPLYVTAPPGDINRLFILEQKTGEIKILNLNTGRVSSTPFLKISSSDLLKDGFEQGLLGLTFHPNYASNGKFYVNYTSPGGGAAGQTKIIEYQVSDDPNLADSATARTILTFNQPEQNHNGGWMAFGPDGYLYVATGDGGGSGFKPGIPSFADNSQDITNNLLGKILRLNVNSDAFPDNPNRNYANPSDNPFVGKTGDDEIWVYGLRNPWRASFDRATGDLYIGDVGQGSREEINFIPSSSDGGENFGWNLKEGTINLGGGSLPSNLVNPIYDYSHSAGKSVIGGYTYRGSVGTLRGAYFFGDFVSGKIWSLRYDGTNVSAFRDRTSELAPNTGSIDQIASFGEDAAGNLYIVDLDGEIYKIEATVPSSPVSMRISDATVVEGQSGNLAFSVTLSQASSSTIKVNYATSNGSAIAGSDYTTTNGTLTFAAGQMSQTISIPILDNNSVEPNETFNVVLSNPTNATLADSTGVGTISDTLVTSVTTALPAQIENLQLAGQGVINGTGNNNNNRITGNGNNNTLRGLAGKDTLVGGNGNDWLIGDRGDDFLNGGVGNDGLTGGVGFDRLTGGSGLDRFRFDVINTGRDSITDFSVQDDTIVLSASAFGGGLVANTLLRSEQFKRGTAFTNSTQRVLYNPDNGRLFFDLDGNNSSSATIFIASLSSGLALTNADIFATT